MAPLHHLMLPVCEELAATFQILANARGEDRHRRNGEAWRLDTLTKPAFFKTLGNMIQQRFI
jgi:hypothetical protein